MLTVSGIWKLVWTSATWKTPELVASQGFNFKTQLSRNEMYFDFGRSGSRKAVVHETHVRAGSSDICYDCVSLSWTTIFKTFQNILISDHLKETPVIPDRMAAPRMLFVGPAANVKTGVFKACSELRQIKEIMG